MLEIPQHYFDYAPMACFAVIGFLGAVWGAQDVTKGGPKEPKQKKEPNRYKDHPGRARPQGLLGWLFQRTDRG